MFKAKLIRNESYYSLKWKQLIFLMLPSIPIGFFVNWDKFPVWVTVLAVVVYVLIIAFVINKNQRKIDKVLGVKVVEMDDGEIRINSKDGAKKEVIDLNTIDEIILKKEYAVPQQTLGDFGSELMGDVKQNYIILKEKGNSRKLYFELESFYMVNQLNKIIENWERKGFTIEKLES